MKTRENVMKVLKCRFSISSSIADDKTDALVTDTLKECLTEYFGTQIEVRIDRKSVESDMLRYLRESVLIEINTDKVYVAYPSVITLEKELRGYTLRFRIRGLDIEKMSKLIKLAHRLIEAQDDINYSIE